MYLLFLSFFCYFFFFLKSGYYILITFRFGHTGSEHQSGAIHISSSANTNIPDCCETDIYK